MVRVRTNIWGENHGGQSRNPFRYGQRPYGRYRGSYEGTGVKKTKKHWARVLGYSLLLALIAAWMHHRSHRATDPLEKAIFLWSAVLTYAIAAAYALLPKVRVYLQQQYAGRQQYPVELGSPLDDILESDFDRVRRECEEQLCSQRGAEVTWEREAPVITEIDDTSWALLPVRLASPEFSGVWVGGCCVAVFRSPEWRGTGFCFLGSTHEAEQELRRILAEEA